MSKIEIGVQLYTLRRYMKKPYNVPAVLKRVKEMGLETVQVSGMCTISAKVLNLITEDIGINICCTHSPFDRIQNDLDNLAKEHLTYGAKVIGVGMMPKKYRKNNFKRLTEFIDIINDASQKLKKYDMKIAYHNHAFEFKTKNNKCVYDILIDDTHKEIEFILDTYWLRVVNVSIIYYLEKLAGRVSILHLKDYKKWMGLPLMCEIGSGELPFKDILAVAENNGVRYALIEQDFSLNPYNSLEKSVKYLENNYLSKEL